MSNSAFTPFTVRVLQQAISQPHALAVQHEEQTLDYRSFAQLAIQYAQYFNSQCPQPNSIALSINSPILLLAAFIGARLLGHNVLVINPEWSDLQQQQCIAKLKPALVMAEQHALTLAAETNTQQSDSTIRSWIECANTDLHLPFYTGFTSGSTGSPKGFTRHELSWQLSFKADEEAYALTAQDTVVSPGKLAHSLFLYASLRALSTGVPLLLLNGLANNAQRQRLRQTPSSVLFAVPAQLRALTSTTPKPFTAPTHPPRVIVSAGAKLEPSLRAALSQQLPNTALFECYGSSELSYIALANPEDNPPVTSVGKAVAGVTLRIEDSDGGKTPTGESGRLWVNSPLRFMGYAASSNSCSLQGIERDDGFIDTGDTASLDAQGFLYLTGRSDRMMQVAGTRTPVYTPSGSVSGSG